MVYGCTNKTMKFFVFFINFLIFAFGAVIFGTCLWVNLGSDSILQDLINKSTVEDVELSKYRNAIWVLAVIGGFLIVTGFLGCCGAACESRILLGLFFVIVLICFLMELGAGIAALVLKDKVKNEVKTILEDVVSKNETVLAEVEKELKCCGINGTATTGHTCPDDTEGVSCVDELWKMLAKNATAVGIIALIVLLVELLAMIFACALCNAFGRHSGYEYA